MLDETTQQIYKNKNSVFRDITGKAINISVISVMIKCCQRMSTSYLRLQDFLYTQTNLN